MEYTKTDIINKLLKLPNILDAKLISERAWLDRLNLTLEFLGKDKVLNKRNVQGKDYYFFSKYINLIPRVELSSRGREAHFFDPLATIVIIAFLAQYEHPFIKNYMKKELPGAGEGENWFNNMEAIIIGLMDDIYIDENGKPFKDSEFMCINILSEIAKFAGSNVYLSYSNEADEHIKRIATKLISLDEENKGILYKRKLKSKLIQLENLIDKSIKNLDVDQYKMFEIDYQIKRNNINQDKLLELIKEHTDEKLQ